MLEPNEERVVTDRARAETTKSDRLFGLPQKGASSVLSFVIP